MIGKGNWQKYIERFIAPRKPEAVLRFLHGALPTGRQKKHSLSWQWRLPKGIAAATDANAVLDTWVLFRHKVPKKVYHYMAVLKRLVEVGGCDVEDWRFRLITSRVQDVRRKVLNVPRLALMLAQLNAVNEVQPLQRWIIKMLREYRTEQLATAVEAWALCKLQDTHLFASISDELQKIRMKEISIADMVKVAQGFATCQVTDYNLYAAFSHEIQDRVSLAVDEGVTKGQTPSLHHLVAMATAFSEVKYQDFAFMEMVSMQLQHMLRVQERVTPELIHELLQACHRLRMPDIELYETVLNHCATHVYDYPSASTAIVGRVTSTALPTDMPQAKAAYATLIEHLQEFDQQLSLRGIENAVVFADRVGDEKLLELCAARLKALRKNQVIYDIARVATVFSERMPQDDSIFDVLSKQVHRHLRLFEPHDFVSASTAFARVSYRDYRVAHAMARWAHRRQREFTREDWAVTVDALQKMGALPEYIEQMQRCHSDKPWMELPEVPELAVN